MSTPALNADPPQGFTKQKVFFLALFLIGLFALDRAIGAGLAVGFAKVQTGEGSGQANYAIKRADRQVMIFGSSRAKQHFDPATFRAALGQDAYNAGANGQGVFYARILQLVMLARGNSQVKTFILHVDAVDLFEPKISRASFLLPYMSEVPEVVTILGAGDKWLWLKSYSHAYRYNSMALPILRNLISARQPDPDGFVAKEAGVQGVADNRQFVGDADAKGKANAPTPKPDPHTMKALEGFIKDGQAAGAQVVLVTSPMSLGKTANAATLQRRALTHEVLSKLTARLGARYLDLHEDQYLVFKDEALFIDRGHLNANGAKVISELLVKELKR